MVWRFLGTSPISLYGKQRKSPMSKALRQTPIHFLLCSQGENRVLLSSVDDRCRGARVAWVDFHFGFQLVGKRLDDAGSKTDLVWLSRILLPPYAVVGD